MRDTKFRGKRIDNGKWVYGHYVKVMDREGDDIDLICTIDTSYPRINGKWYLEDTVEVIPETVGQFTGLKDKNGKEAYRKDEVSALGYSNWIIEWHKNGWKLKQKDTENYYDIPKDFIILGIDPL